MCLLWFSSLTRVFAVVQASDKRITCDEEFSDSDDEGGPVRREAGKLRKHQENYKNKRLKIDNNTDGTNTDKVSNGESCCATCILYHSTAGMMSFVDVRDSASSIPGFVRYRSIPEFCLILTLKFNIHIEHSSQ